VFHAGNPAGERDFEAVRAAHAALAGVGTTGELVERLAAHGYRWGTSNGT
jgi:hypothetical protein